MSVNPSFVYLSVFHPSALYYHYDATTNVIQRINESQLVHVAVWQSKASNFEETVGGERGRLKLLRGSSDGWGGGGEREED